ncbi:Putative WD domain-containing protein [[Torrubiella] hemipterigena]|uniref:Putative WD domain-containing protein n=1 Tax=[Torrubiella] hemipterigena TaxID=1531966 RepID=A0A0A1T254_9HYPO|nr:Putative WD domain-containing protein [[Torrubiella] hemipterigena]
MATLTDRTVSSTHRIQDDSTEASKDAPELIHSLKHNSTVLALAVSPQHGSIFAGTQDGEIVVWSLSTFHKMAQIQAHKRSVLSLFLSNDSSLLLSSAGDAIINVWCPKTLRRLYEIYGSHDVGDIFCTAYSSQHDTVYLGAQNASIQWVKLDDPSTRVTHGSERHPDKRSHKFFDSKAIGGGSTPRRNEDRWSLIPRANTVLEMDSSAIQNFAHNGYVFCMLMAKGPTVEVDEDDDVLISGAGDGTIKLWELGQGSRDGLDEGEPDRGGIEEIMTLGTDDGESILSLALDGSFLYAGKLDGVVELWDLDTAQRLRSIKSHDYDIMSLQMGWGYLWTASSSGWASQFSTAHYGKYQQASGNVAQKYQCLSNWKAHNGKILASATTTFKDQQYYITGANDEEIGIWAIKDSAKTTTESNKDSDDLLLNSLADFVSYKTVSSKPEYSEDCRKGATFLGSLFKRLGGDVEMLNTDNDYNPVVYAKFSGKKETAGKKKRILFYGHYDVVPADNNNGKWSTEPFTAKGTNGFLYGRGVSDNKGPIIAALFAVTDLMQAKQLENDVIFLIEGEEEFGSRGFGNAVKRNKERIGPIDYILLANSYWLDDEVPCLTYGLRGVLHATVCVDSPRPDAHSGVDGSHMTNEPLSDLTQVLAKLKGKGNRVRIPGFYEGIPSITSDEEARFDDIASVLLRRNKSTLTINDIKESIMARWREPNLTIHRYKVSGPDGSLVSSHASSHISMRLVPGQEADDIAIKLQKFLAEEFGDLESQNQMSISIDNKSEAWLGDPTNDIFRILGEAIVEAWPDRFDASPKSGKPKQPLYIREGGSIPAIRFLEKEFQAPAAHLPCGRASDSAHLDNERMSVVNLLKAREIFGKVFQRL